MLECTRHQGKIERRGVASSSLEGTDAVLPASGCCCRGAVIIFLHPLSGNLVKLLISGTLLHLT